MSDNNIPATCPWCGAARTASYGEITRWDCESRQWLDHAPYQSEECKLILANREIETRRAERDEARDAAREIAEFHCAKRDPEGRWRVMTMTPDEIIARAQLAIRYAESLKAGNPLELQWRWMYPEPGRAIVLWRV